MLLKALSLLDEYLANFSLKAYLMSSRKMLRTLRHCLDNYLPFSKATLVT